MSEASDITRRRATTEDGASARRAVPPPFLGGRLELLQELGSGSSGTVYRARTQEDIADLPAGSEVAVKFLRQDRMHDQRARDRLLAEGRLGQRVRHPNVAGIFGAETIGVLGIDVTYLVMELVRGTTLRAYLQQQGPPVEDLTRRIGGDAAAGLHALHRRGVVHRDVKPENLVLTPEGSVKVVDLGLARAFGEVGGGSSPGSGMAGSVSYAAPEVLRGQPAQPRSDLYSLGIVLYEVATGRHPFAHHTTADEMLHAHLFEAPASPSRLRPRMSPLLEQLLLELLAKEPDARPRDADAVARILQHGEHGEWWRRHVERAPVLASARRLRRMRRLADVPFVGRAAEQQRLDAALAGARAGRGAALCITAPQGTGRRRLLDECMARWLQDGEDLLYLGGEADPGLGHGQPFAGTLLDHLLAGDSKDSLNAAVRLRHRARDELQWTEPDAESLASVVAGTSDRPPEVRAELASRAILQLARPGRTVVLRVDHADALDTSGRLVLRLLLAEVPGRHLLLLLTAGPEGMPDPGIQHIDLAGLEEDAFLAFGRALFRDGEAPDDLLHAGHVALSGGPGNLIEALEHLVQTDQLRGRSGDYHDPAPDAVLRPAPGHLQRFQTRVAAMAPDHRRILETAAILGDRLPLADLAAMVDVPELRVLETLSLFRGRVLRAQGGEVVFRHRDFQKALLRQIAEPVRQDLHRRAAAALRARSAPELEVGLHLSHALDHEACLDPLLDGLQGLVQRGSRRTSLRVAARLKVHFQHASPGPDNDRRRLRWLLLHARAQRNVARGDAAEELFRAANDLARALGDETRVGDALTGLAACAMDRGRLLGAVELLERAHDHLDGLDPEEPRRIAARAHGLHARILLYLGQSTDGLRHVQHALRTLPEGETEQRCHMLVDLARLEALRNHYPTALKTLRRVEEELESVHLPRARMRLLLYRGQFRALTGDDAAVRDLRTAAAEAERLSLPAFAGRAHVYLGERAFRRYRDAEARQELELARSLAGTAGDPLGATLSRILLFRLGNDAGDLTEQVADLGLPSLRAAWLLATGARSSEAGDRQAAADWTAKALAVMESADLPLSLQVRILHLADRQATARSLVRGIAERFPERSLRRRFLAQWDRRVRI